ncbi:unnamed protein product [Didymodactylos carnosus]|uniref:HAT C-terminal dimerisation domain-containing protein n=1 Tax=Didymodactylos carnosus TaxID=1234261 RepID=A0A8S2ELY1_9BILA|nr:unnamed protein product [Didymodactylos carnosus]CAF4017571.1 unnamed protein product [Didymodactylos carnosus]
MGASTWHCPHSSISSTSVLQTVQNKSTKKGNPKSYVEKLFVNYKEHADGKTSSECLVCKHLVTHKIGVTSNYTRHMQRHHLKMYTEWIDSLKNNDNKDVIVTQPKIKHAFNNNKTTKYGSQHPRQIELNNMIINDLIIDLGLPLSIVERPAFLRAMSKVDSKFHVQSRRSICRESIPALYDKMIRELKTICTTAEFISLTLDIWIDRRMRPFYAVTGHSIIDCVFKSYVLSFLPLTGSHTDKALLNEFEKIISSDYNIENKLVRLVTDNAANNVKAFKSLIVPGFEHYFEGDEDDDDDDDRIDDDDSETDENNLNGNTKNIFNTLANDNSVNLLRIPCFSHTLQLVVADGLKESSCARSSLAKVTKIAKYSHQSTKFAENLEANKYSIPVACKTRWNSQYNTVMKIIEIPVSVLNEYLKHCNKEELRLTSRDIAILREFHSLFALFAEAIVRAQAQNSPSISLVAPSLLGIFFDLENELKNCCIYTSSLCKVLITSLKARFGAQLDSQSELSDPVKESLCQLIKKLVTDAAFQLNSSKDSSSSSNYYNAADDDKGESSDIVLGEKRKTLFGYCSSQNKIKKTRIDIQNSVQDEIVSFQKKIVYAILSKLAQKLLCVPATSAPVERVFSQSGFLFRSHRCKMTKSTLSKLTLLKCNFELLK